MADEEDEHDVILRHALPQLAERRANVVPSGAADADLGRLREHDEVIVGVAEFLAQRGHQRLPQGLISLMLVIKEICFFYLSIL